MLVAEVTVLLCRKAGPFCRTCNRAFSTRGSLNRHMEMHQPFRVKHACHLCFKEFAWPSDLTTHLRISHGSPHTRRVGRFSYTKAKLPPSWGPSLFALLAFDGIACLPFVLTHFEIYVAVPYLFWPSISSLSEGMLCLSNAGHSRFNSQQSQLYIIMAKYLLLRFNFTFTKILAMVTYWSHLMHCTECKMMTLHHSSQMFRTEDVVLDARTIAVPPH